MRSSLLTLVLTIAFAGSAVACLWDSETLRQERARFPEILELITGKFPRHSEAYYRWRIQDREQRLANEEPTPELYDDLSVAYEKLGQHEQAIELARQSDELWPNRYETQANLGTFLIHAKQYEQGLKHIERALEINPDAHFGRERYQKYLVEYLLGIKDQNGEIPKPTMVDVDLGFGLGGGFAKYLLFIEIEEQKPGSYSEFVDTFNRDNSGETFSDDYFDTEPDCLNLFIHNFYSTRTRSKEPVISNALKGVTGMMRFGNYNSPILLEALGSLLMVSSNLENSDAKHLAARAFLKASYETNNNANYRELASRSIKMIEGVEGDLSHIEPGFQRELAEAEAWFQSVAEAEQKWIDAGADVEAEFMKSYLVSPPRIETESDPNFPLSRASLDLMMRYVLFGFGMTVLTLALIVGKGRFFRFVNRMFGVSESA